MKKYTRELLLGCYSLFSVKICLLVPRQKKFNREKQNKIKQSKTFVKYSREFYWCGDVTFETFIFQVFDEAKRMWLYDFVVYH